MTSLRIVYFGTPAFAAETLSYLLSKGVEVLGVVTQPDRPQGRSGRPVPSPVKEAAGSLPLLQPEKASDPHFLEQLRNWDADLYVVVAFGQILPQALLDIPPKGCINVHASLLPKYRGAAPMQRALMNGEVQTGIAIQKMVRKLDAGDVIANDILEIPPNMTLEELRVALCELAKPLLFDVICKFQSGIPEATKQDESKVTFAPKIESHETQIDWGRTAYEIHNQIRALSPRPGAWSWVEVGGERKRLKILRSRVDPRGEVACGEGALQLLEVQPEGKRPMPYSDWMRGCRTTPVFPVQKKDQ